MSQKAVLLINLGTPDECSHQSIRSYLREFLLDRRVIDLPAMIRWILVNVFVIPFRYKKTTAAYQKIWTPSGSPLLSISRQMQKALAEKLGEAYHVELGMRYGSPSIESALDKIRHHESICVIPLFPQYSSAATGSATEQLMLNLSQQWNIPELMIKRDFYNHSGFIQAFSEMIKSHIAGKKMDKIIFSYHGLPERHITKSHCHAKCDKAGVCPAVTDDNRYCYRAQCYAGTELIAKELGLSVNQYTVSFQSRLGRTPWIKPYTDLLLSELIQKGIKNIAIVSPSFVADCLETLEEINIRTREQWKILGGNDFIFIPCLNDTHPWINALADLVLENSAIRID